MDPHAAQRLFAHKVLAFLQRKDLISEQRLQLISSWKHSGFSVHNAVYVSAGDHSALEALIRYLMRPPVSLARLRLIPGGREVLHFPKGGDDDPGSTEPERIDAMEYVARVLAPRCASTMRVVAFITEPAQIKRILDHLRRREPVARPPPHVPQPVASTA